MLRKFAQAARAVLVALVAVSFAMGGLDQADTAQRPVISQPTANTEQHPKSANAMCDEAGPFQSSTRHLKRDKIALQTES